MTDHGDNYAELPYQLCFTNIGIPHGEESLRVPRLSSIGWRGRGIGAGKPAPGLGLFDGENPSGKKPLFKEGLKDSE